MALADNPEALADYLEAEAGVSVIRDLPRFTVEFPLADRARVAGKLKELNLGCKPIREFQDRDRNGKMCSILRVEVQRAMEKTTYDEERGLMAAICRNIDK